MSTDPDLHLDTPLAKAVLALFERALPLLDGSPPGSVRVLAETKPKSRPRRKSHPIRGHRALRDQRLDRLVVAATKAPLDRLDQSVATAFAQAFWYKADEMSLSLEWRLGTPNLPPVRKRRLMYLVDRLRRFPCMAPEHAITMKSLVSRWQNLAAHLTDNVIAKAAQVNRYDKLAMSWGMVEDVGSVMNMVLELQTRHFVDQNGLPSGYPSLRGTLSQKPDTTPGL